MVLRSDQVWIATTNGVNLYNGKSLVAFRLRDASINDGAAVIDAIASEQNRAVGIYSLSGQRLSQPVKGLNIVSGRKVLVK